MRPSQRVLAVLDWELSTLGNPLADFAYHIMPWRLGPQAYRGLLGHDLPALDIPTEEQGCALYCRRTGRTALPHWDFYIAFNMFRLAAILQGINGTGARRHGGECPCARIGPAGPRHRRSRLAAGRGAGKARRRQRGRVPVTRFRAYPALVILSDVANGASEAAPE